MQEDHEQIPTPALGGTEEKHKQMCYRAGVGETDNAGGLHAGDSRHHAPQLIIAHQLGCMTSCDSPKANATDGWVQTLHLDWFQDYKKAAAC